MIRPATSTDMPAVMSLIRELAEYEKAGHEVRNTVEQMVTDGFGEHPVFGCFVAEADGGIVGMAVYYFRYSTWKGKRLWLEDIVVTREHRGKGYGKDLFLRVLKHSLEQGCTGVMWQVLDWNEPAIGFYEKHGARFDDEWINCHLEADGIERLLGQSEKD